MLFPVEVLFPRLGFKELHCSWIWGPHHFYSTSYFMFEAISVLDDCFEWRIVVLCKTNRWASDLTYFFIWTFLSRKKRKLSRRGKIQRCVDECKAYNIYDFWFNSLPLFERFLDCFVLFCPLIGANLSFSSILSWLLISLNVSDLTGQKVGQSSNQPQTTKNFPIGIPTTKMSYFR